MTTVYITTTTTKGAKCNLWSEVLQELKTTVFLKLYYPELCSSNVEEA